MIQVHKQGLTRPIDAVVHSSGYRARLRQQIQNWTIDELVFRPRAVDSAKLDPIKAAEWLICVRYRELLTELGSEDDAGISVWASKYLGHGNRAGARHRSTAPESWTFLAFEGATPAQRRVLEYAVRRDGPVRVALAYESDAAVGDVYLATAAVRTQLLELGFVESEIHASTNRPAGLRAMEHVLFRDSPASKPAVSNSQGLAIFGAPRERELVGWSPARFADSFKGECPLRKS